MAHCFSVATLVLDSHESDEGDEEPCCSGTSHGSGCRESEDMLVSHSVGPITQTSSRLPSSNQGVDVGCRCTEHRASLKDDDRGEKDVPGVVFQPGQRRSREAQQAVAAFPATIREKNLPTPSLTLGCTAYIAARRWAGGRTG